MSLRFFCANFSFGIQLQLTTTQTRFFFSELIKSIKQFVFEWVWVWVWVQLRLTCTYRFARFHVFVVWMHACTSHFKLLHFVMCLVQCVCCNYDYYCWYFFTILWHRRWSFSAVCLKTYSMLNIIYLVDAFASQSTAWCTNTQTCTLLHSTHHKRWIGTKKFEQQCKRCAFG